MDDPILETDKGTKKQLDGRDLAVVRFAGSLLKRTLSESFAGVPVPLTEGCEHPPECGDDEFSSNKKNKLVLNAKSLSLELARHKHRLAAQLVSYQKLHLELHYDFIYLFIRSGFELPVIFRLYQFCFVVINDF